MGLEGFRGLGVQASRELGLGWSRTSLHASCAVAATATAACLAVMIESGMWQWISTVSESTIRVGMITHITTSECVLILLICTNIAVIRYIQNPVLIIMAPKLAQVVFPDPHSRV